MATSSQPNPQGTVFNAGFDASINLDNVQEKVYPFANGTAPHLTNSGILRDDGVTNIYSTQEISSDDQVFYAPNGKKVSLSYSGQSVSVDGSKVGTIGPYGLSSRSTVPFGAIDWALTSSGTGLSLTTGKTYGSTSAFSTTSAPAAGWKAVASSGSVLVAVAATTSTTAGIARSIDGGVTWTFVTTSAPAGNWQDVAYSTSAVAFFAIAATTSKTAGLAKSTDAGVTWSFITTTPTPASAYQSISCGTFTRIAIVTSSSGTNSVLESTDGGATFTGYTPTGGPASRDDGCYVSVNVSTRYLMVSGSGSLYYTDLSTFSVISSGITNPSKIEQFSTGMAIVLSSSASSTGVAITTPSGVPSSWTWANPNTGLPAAGWIGASYGGGVMQIVANTTNTTAGIARSTDNGVTWAFITTSSPGGAWTCTAYSTNLVTLANTTSTTAGILYGSKNAPLQSYIVQEYNTSSGAILNTTTLTTTFTNLPNYACLVKGHQMTFATADVAYIYFTGTAVTCAVFVSGVSKSIFNAAGNPAKFTGISAFKNGGTYVVGGVPTTASMPQTYSLPSPYTTPALVGTECSYVANYEEFNTASSLALNLIATPSSLSSANWTTFGTKIVISTGGVVTPTTITQAGLTIVPADTYSGFGWASGRYKSTAATKFSPFILDNAGTPITITETVTDYYSRPVPVCSFGLTANKKTYLYGIGVVDQQGKNASPAQLVWGGTYGAMTISEYGILRNDSPVCQWLDANGAYYVSTDTDNGIQVSTIGANTYQMFPISKYLVQITDNFGTIVNTLTGTVEVNAGAHSPGFVSDIYLTGTSFLANQTNFAYSNAVDIGSSLGVYAGIPASGMTATSISGAVILPMVFYQSASAGTLYAKALLQGGAQIATDTSIAYVANSNVPPPVDAIYSGGGIQLEGISALQTINESDADAFSQYYAGYTLSNQYPISYQFFNLFGQLYGFDGQKIYRMPVNGATAGIPEQLAIAQGLRFVTNSPTVAVFVSDFDNTLYVFTGGANVTKHMEMTGMALVSSGVYSVRENSLYLQLADNTILTVRDDKAGSLANAYTSQTAYATDLGTYFVNNATPSQSTLWSYYAGTGTPLTLTWQSGYYGVGNNQYCRVTQWVITLKVADPTTTAITVNYKWLSDNSNGTESFTFAAGSYTASATGYTRLQYSPTQAVCYGSSFGISCSKKVILYDAVCYYTDGGVAPVVVANRNT